MDAGEVRRRVLWKAVRSPWVIGLGLVGLWALATGLLAGGLLGALGLVGVVAIAAAVAIALLRATRGAERLTAAVLDEARQARIDAGTARLKAVERRLEKTRDTRTFRDIRSLRSLRQRVLDAVEMETFYVPPEVASMSGQLYTSCVDSLERSAVLWETARKMATAAARDELMAKREALLQEVSRSVEQWAKTVDQLQAAPLQREGDEELARIRDELGRNLEVARHVEARMQALERELAGPTRVAG